MSRGDIYEEGWAASRWAANPYWVNSAGWILWERGHGSRWLRHEVADEIRTFVIKQLERFIGMTSTKELAVSAKHQIESALVQLRNNHKDFAFLWRDPPRFDVMVGQCKAGTELRIVPLNESANEILYGPVDKPTGG